jgi:legumain
MYDDIANNPSNPKPGSIINYVGGPNVYPGVPKDYTGSTVVPANFLKLLHGQDMSGIGSGKSLKSGPNDKVFIFFTDHGGPGIICFPGFIELHVADLIDALKYMHDNSMYKELVFYMEACESGSMFNKVLPTDWNIYAVTASNPTESSWACDYDSTYRAYLNDCWSRNFLNDTRWALDNKAMNTRTYKEQFDWVKEQTTQSPECEYGFLDIQAETLDQFQGWPGSFYQSMPLGKAGKGIDARDVHLRTLEMNIEVENNLEKKQALKNELEEYKLHMHDMDLRWNAFSSRFNIKPEQRMVVTADSCHPADAVMPRCMKDMVETVKAICGAFDEYTVRYYKLLHFACLDGIDVNDVAVEMKNICSVV